VIQIAAASVAGGAITASALLSQILGGWGEVERERPEHVIGLTRGAAVRVRYVDAPWGDMQVYIGVGYLAGVSASADGASVLIDLAGESFTIRPESPLPEPPPSPGDNGDGTP